MSIGKPSKSASIAVIGCGPAGLAASVFMRRMGHKVTLYEQFEHAKPVGAGMMLQPTGLSVLNDLGLLEKVIDRGQQLSRICGLDAKSGRQVLDVHYRHLGRGRFGLGIHRHALFQVLYDCACEEGVCFEFGEKIVNLKTTSIGIKPVNDSGYQRAEFDYIVTANGSNSSIANHMFKLKPPEPLAFGALWTSVNWPQSGFQRNELSQRYDGAKVMIGVLPLGTISDQAHQSEKKAALFWSLKRENLYSTLDQGIHAWKNKICDYWPQAEALVGQIDHFDELTFADYRHSTLKTPYGRRVVFIGDSYHSTSPQLGQGANMALLDAKALDLALRHCGDDFNEVGEIFHQLRSRHIQLFQAMSIFLTPFYQSDSAFSGFLRDQVISQISRIPPAPKLMAAILSGLFMKPFRQITVKGQRLDGFREPEWHQYHQTDFVDEIMRS